jgi:hypothetical protein
MTDPKPFWQSRTVWFNALTIALAIIGFLMVTQSTSGLPLDLDPKWLVIASGIINILLRFLTNAPLAGSKPQ